MDIKASSFSTLYCLTVWIISSDIFTVQLSLWHGVITKSFKGIFIFTESLLEQTDCQGRGKGMLYRRHITKPLSKALFYPVVTKKSRQLNLVPKKRSRTWSVFKQQLQKPANRNSWAERKRGGTWKRASVGLRQRTWSLSHRWTTFCMKY